MPKIVKFGISLLFLAGALYILDWPSLKLAVLELDPYLFAGITVYLVIVYVVLGYRWYMLVNAVAPLGFYEHLRRYMLAVFFSSFTPAQIGGDVYRFFSIRNEGARGSHLLGLLARERLIGLGSFLLFYLICFGALTLIGDPLASSGLFEFAALLCAVGLAGLASGSALIKTLSRLGIVTRRTALQRAVEVLGLAFHTGPAVRFTGIMGLSQFALVMWTLAIYWLAGSAGYPVHFLIAGMIAVLVELVRSIPISVQGVGVREASFAYLFTLAGHAPEEGFVVGAAAFLAVSLSLCLAGALGAVMPVRQRQQTGRVLNPGTGA